MGRGHHHRPGQDHPDPDALLTTNTSSIPLDELRYWSVDRQEAYASPEISLQRELEVNPDMRKRG